MRVAAALVGGLALVGVALGVTLSGSPLRVARANLPPTSLQTSLAETEASAAACQGGEVLPAGTSAIRLTLQSDSGPRVKLTALSGSEVLTSGVTGQGWTSGAVTVPVRPVKRTASNVRICFHLGATREHVELVGSPTSGADAVVDSTGERLPGRLGVEYLRPSRSSWWSALGTVARHMGLGRAASGPGIAVLVLVAMGAVVSTASWLALRELR